MNKGSGCLRLISGVGKKGPACFLIEAEGKRILLDLGEGPPPGALPDVAGIGRIDAVDLEPRPQGPCRRPFAVAEARRSAGLRHRHRRARLAERHCRAPAAGRRHRRGARHCGCDRPQRPCAGRHLASLRHRRRLSLYRGLRDPIAALCLRSAAENGGDRAARLLLRRLSKAARGNVGTTLRHSWSAARCCFRCRPTAAVRKSRSN